MAWDHFKAFKATLIFIKYVTWPLSLVLGIHVLIPISSGAFGFKFLGILFIVIGIMSLILFCVDCAIFDRAEGVFLTESLCCGIPLYLLMIGLGIFALAVSSHGTGKSIPGITYKEYELTSCSKLMQSKVNDTHLWEKYYKRALIKHHVCSDMTSIYRADTLDKFHQRPLNPFESGCCKPPDECKFNYTSPTIWINSTNNDNSSTNIDCYKWSNDPNTYCFDCESCKAAFAQDVKHYWSLPGIMAIVVLVKFVLATLFYCLGICCNLNMKW
ncbi:hypothetical protein RND81_01G202100 [Saponaria officinalis]|uniref:Uncharacterized protein n=1 Tax=Saponaria officinalis TaxID=3572 RepID=A0AAW1NHM1_SAPOF